MKLSHRERIERAITGAPVDRVPVSLWRHFPVDDQNPENLARSVVRFQNTFDFDFVKITPSSSYCLKDWGVKDEWKGNPEGTREFTSRPIEQAADWLKLKPISPTRGGLGDQLHCIELIRNAIPIATPVIQTIFSPLSQAKNLVGKDQLTAHMRQYPDEVKAALQVITNVTIEFINKCLPLNIDGIFFAVQHAQYSILSLQEFQEFGTSYDMQVLRALKPFWFNVGHIHGSKIMFDELAKYPIQVLNWHDLETPPDLESGKGKFNGAVCGGLRQWETLAYGTPDQVKLEARNSIKLTHGSRFILGTGCVTPIITPEANLFAVKEAVEKTAGRL